MKYFFIPFTHLVLHVLGFYITFHRKKKKINVVLRFEPLENKYLKEKDQNGEEKNLSLFLYSLKNTPFNGLNLNEADNLKAKNDIILEKYNEILAGQHDTEYLTFHHFIKH